MKRIIIGAAIFLMITNSGCGDHRPQQPPAVSPDVSSPEPAVLPELEQNKMYLTNKPLVSGPQDTSFEPVSDELQHPSDEDKELQDRPASD